ncbi:hypothetical protein GCM10029976_042130 [Kribbella albertanoniae]
MTRRSKAMLTALISLSALMYAPVTAAANSAPLCRTDLSTQASGTVIRTCLEQQGRFRRAVSTVFNGSTQRVLLGRLDAFISYPNYGESKCGPIVGEPGQVLTCTTPWVPPTLMPHSDGIVHTFVTVFQSPGEHFIHRVPLPTVAPAR